MPYSSPEKEKLLAAYDAAPQAVQDALTDGVAINFFLSMPGEYKISQKLSIALTEMGRDVLIGLLTPKDFDTYLRELVGKDTADRLIKDFNTKVLTPLLSGKLEVKKPSISVGEVLIQTKPPQGNTPIVTAPTPVAPLPPKTAPLQPLKVSVAPATTQLPPLPPSTTAKPTVTNLPVTLPTEQKLPVVQTVQPPMVPALSKEGIAPPKPVATPPQANKPVMPPPPKPVAPNSTPLINKYVADPYREMPEVDK